MLRNIIDYFTGGNIETIELRPSKSNRFLNGIAYLSTLDNNGGHYCPPLNSVISKIEFIQLENGNHPHSFEISYGHHTLLDNVQLNGQKIERNLNIKTYFHHHIVIKLKNTKIKLPIEVIPDFKIIITIKKNSDPPLNYNYFLNSFVFEEITPPIETALLRDKKNIGLCFSGGGPRSFVATLGYLRALMGNDYLWNVRYVSAISGSTWAWVPFTYLDRNLVSEDIFLGLDIFGDLSKKLDLTAINYTAEFYLGDCIISRAANWKLIEYIYESFKYLPYGDRSRIWPFMLGKIFLEPFDLLDANFFTFNRELRDIFKREPLNIGDNHWFRLPHDEDRPFLISCANIVKPEKRGTLVNTDFYQLMMTPFYIGLPSEIKYNNLEFGGELINSYAFHPIGINKEEKKGEKKDNKVISMEISHTDNNFQRFNLFDLMGASSSAYGVVGELIGFEYINPSYRILDSAEHKKLETFDLVDGGVLDDAGILPLLQKGVKKIMVFCNSNERIGIEKGDEEMTKSIDAMIRQLFLGNVEINKRKYFHYFEYVNDLQVFENCDNENWKKLLEQLRSNIKNYDAPFVELNGLNVLENKELRISPYILDTLIIVFLYQTDSWTNERLDDNVRELLKSRRFANFPNYSTVFENSTWFEAELLQMNADEVNLLADLTYWNLTANEYMRNRVKDFFS